VPIVTEIHVERPPEAVTAYLLDYANEARWQHNVSEAIPEPPGPARVGTRVRKVRRTGMGVQRFVTQVVAVDEAARRWSDRVVTGTFRDTTGAWSVDPEGIGSRVRLVADMKAPWPWKLLLPLIERLARKDLAAEFQTLKRLLENGAATAGRPT